MTAMPDWRVPPKSMGIRSVGWWLRAARMRSREVMVCCIHRMWTAGVQGGARSAARFAWELRAEDWEIAGGMWDMGCRRS